MVKPHGPSGLESADELELGWSLNRQRASILAIQNPSDIRRSALEQVNVVEAICDEARPSLAVN